MCEIEEFGSIHFGMTTKTVCFDDKRAVDKFIIQFNINTLSQFNKLALVFLEEIHPEVFAQATDEEKAQWQLGALSAEVGEYLFAQLNEAERGELISIVEG